MSLTGKVRCKICDYEREIFICPDCISGGNFGLSKKRLELIQADINKQSNCKHGGGNKVAAPILAKFSEKKAELRVLQEKVDKINAHYDSLLADRILKESLEQTIIERKLKNQAIRKLVAIVRGQAQLANERASKIERSLKSADHNRQKFINEIDSVKKSLVKVNKRLAKATNDFERVRDEVREATKTSMLLLKERIFPFYCDKGCLNSTATNSVDETYSSKEGSLFIADSETDSFSTTCCPPSMGSWAAVESNCQRYYIVEPWIPKYSVAQPYINWLNKMEETCKLSPIGGEPDGDDRYIFKNDAYRVSAALSYITQLLELVSFVTDVQFPKQLNFVEFFTKFNDTTENFLTEDEILHKVAKLNTNLIYLCLSQKVDGRLIVPTHTGHNLSLLFDPNHATYTKSGPIYIDTESHRRVEDSLYHDYILVDSAGESHDFPSTEEIYDEESIGPDWESVTSSPVLASYDLYASQQSTTSMTGGIISVAETALYAMTSFIRRQ